MRCGFRGSCGCERTSGPKTRMRLKPCVKFIKNRIEGGATGVCRAVTPGSPLCESVRVPVVLVLVVFVVLIFDRNHTAVRGLADHVFELNRGVVDSEARAQLFFDFAQDAITL